jgi:hypothetical protein
MKKAEENKTENCTIVNGVVLTEKAIEILKQFQETDNYWLKYLLEEISNTVCFLAKKMDDYTKGQEEAVILMSLLGQLRDELKALQKP